MPVTFAAEACDELVKFPGCDCLSSECKLIPHPENVPVASGKNVATVGFHSTLESSSLYGDNLPVATPMSWSP